MPKTQVILLNKAQQEKNYYPSQVIKSKRKKTKKKKPEPVVQSLEQFLSEQIKVEDQEVDNIFDTDELS